jgi:glycosyltransferase involved in cell wall biosynthesis
LWFASRVRDEHPDVSVVVTVLNEEAAIDELLDRTASALDGAAWEVIVVDDGSTDRTAEVVQGFGDAVRYDRQPRTGASVARNRGVELATGELIAFLDADDLWTERALPCLIAALERDPAAGMAVGQMVQFVSPELPDSARLEFQFSPEPVAARMCGTVLVRRTEFDRAGGFSPELASGEFIDWFARAEAVGVRSVAVDEVVLRRRLHRQNHGVIRRDTRQDYVRVVKAALDRKRALEARRDNS